jgi:hypothetical protein
MRNTRPQLAVPSALALGAAVAAFLVLSLGARPAEARLVDLHAGAIAGGITGWGSDQPDFFSKRGRPGVGVEAGVKLLVIDLSFNFFQMFDGSGAAGTLSQVLLGVNVDIPVGNQTFRSGVERGKSRNVIRPIASFGGALATPKPVDLPLNNAQLAAKGIVSYVGAGYEHFLNEFIGVGAEASFGYHYLWGGGMSEFVTGQTHSSGYQLTGFATVTFHLGY